MTVRIPVLNFVVNQPEVRPHVAPGYETVDLSNFYSNVDNVALGDERGVILFGYMGNNRFEMHYLFTAALRGREALNSARLALDTMFTRYNARVICGFTPRENRAARVMNRALGAQPVGVFVDGQGRACIHYVLERKQWATSSQASLAESAPFSEGTSSRRPMRKARSNPLKASIT